MVILIDVPDGRTALDDARESRVHSAKFTGSIPPVHDGRWIPPSTRRIFATASENEIEGIVGVQVHQRGRSIGNADEPSLGLRKSVLSVSVVQGCGRVSRRCRGQTRGHEIKIPVAVHVAERRGAIGRPGEPSAGLCKIAGSIAQIERSIRPCLPLLNGYSVGSKGIGAPGQQQIEVPVAVHIFEGSGGPVYVANKACVGRGEAALIIPQIYPCRRTVIRVQPGEDEVKRSVPVDIPEGRRAVSNASDMRGAKTSLTVAEV